MDAGAIVALVKEGIGIKHTARDTYLTAIVEGVIKELEDEKGLALDSANPSHLMFCVDFAMFRYENAGQGTMPRHLQYRLHNLTIKTGGSARV